MFGREQEPLPGRAVGLKTPQTGEKVRIVSFGGSAGVGGCRARCGLVLGLAAVAAIAFASSAAAANDPLGAVTQAAAPVTNAAAPTATTATAGVSETASATTAAAQTATKSVHPPTPPAEREVSETVRSAGAAVDSAVHTAKRTGDSAVATTTRVVNDATRPPAPAAGAHATQATHATRAGLKVEASHARPPSRHPGVTHRRTAEPRTSPATAARALDLAPAPRVAAEPAHRDGLSPAAATSRGERASGPQPLSPTAPLHGGAAAAGASAAASGAGIVALLLATFILAAPAIRRRLHAPPPGHWPAAPVFLLERPG
jgi:hypothetical protein